MLNSSTAHAHPGRTDSSGGHTCRTNCESWGLEYGEYHSHGGSAPVQTAPVVQEKVNTPIPTRLPIKIPTKVIYKETAMDKKKMFKVTKIYKNYFVASIRGREEKIKIIDNDCETKQTTKDLLNKFVKLKDNKNQGKRDAYGYLQRHVYLENKIICI